MANVAVAGNGAVVGCVANGADERVGSFRFYFDGARWEWSAEVADMHGYGAEAMSPTAAQLLSHGYPRPTERGATGFDVFRRDCAAFSASRRIVDTQGRVRDVIVAGGHLRDEGGAVIGTHGFFVDVSPPEDVVQRRLTEALADIAADRALIEQAKGMLGAVYGITADTAFDVLRWRSQATNVKLKVIARQVIQDFLAVNSHPLPPRSTYDRLLLTAHERVT